VPDIHVEAFERLAAGTEVRVTCIGEIVAGNSIECRDKKGTLLQTNDHAYEHFL
jgi:thiamine monophosphate kinase